ncbi:MAG: Ppx/GppA family phosphatase [Planctomycetales bacterium]|nr:Ppx/GppA family phosphatase [Planctomycetales bacterium]
MRVHGPRSTVHGRTATAPFAVVDLGSNSVRMLVVAARPGGTYRVLDDERVGTRLAAGIGATGRLDPDAVRRTLAALRLMRRIARNHGAAIAAAVATSAVREAPERDAFLARAARALGAPVRTIPGEEEAMLAFESARRHFALGPGRTAVLDLGGGSAEIVLAAGGAVERAVALPLGAVRLTEEFLFDNPPRKRELLALGRHVARTLARALPRGATADRVIASGGTISALAALSQSREGETLSSVHGYSLNPGQVRHLVEWLARRTSAERAELPGISPDRADLIVAGAAVVDGVLGRLRARSLVASAHGVREGLVLRLLREASGGRGVRAPGDLRREGVLRFAERCGFERRHAEHVARLALRLWDQAAPAAGLPPETRGLLEAAALLHDVGYAVGYEGHHRHAYSLILHADLPGFSAREVRLVANVARYHTGGRPKKKHRNFRELPREDRNLVRALAALLRIADGLDRAHGRDVRDVQLRRRDGITTIAVHATRDGDLGLDGARAKARLFERAFGTSLEFRLAPGRASS